VDVIRVLINLDTHLIASKGTTEFLSESRIEQLHCDMFENSLLPIALANKLVS